MFYTRLASTQRLHRKTSSEVNISYTYYTYNNGKITGQLA